MTPNAPGQEDTAPRGCITRAATATILNTGPITVSAVRASSAGDAEKYVAEMFCDRLAASKVYRGQDFQPGDPYQFFQYGKKKRLLMHPATSELLETILIVLRDQGEDAAFDYVRREVLGRSRFFHTGIM